MSQCTISENLATARKEVREKFLASSGHNNPCGNPNHKYDPKPMAWGLIATIREA